MFAARRRFAPTRFNALCADSSLELPGSRLRPPPSGSGSESRAVPDTLFIHLPCVREITDCRPCMWPPPRPHGEAARRPVGHR